MRDAGAMARLRPLLTAALATVGVALVAAPAGAHVEPEVTAVPAGGEATVTFVAEHGCGDSPTIRVEMQLPEGVADAQAVEKEGWLAEVTDGVALYEWEGVGGDESGEFGLTFTAPDTPGATLLFPTIQSCTEGSVDWIQEETDGDRPAPRVRVGEADEPTTTTEVAEQPATDGPEATTTPATDDEATPEPTDDETATATADDDEGGGGRLVAIAAVVAVIGGLGVFAAAKLRKRQEP